MIAITDEHGKALVPVEKAEVVKSAAREALDFVDGPHLITNPYVGAAGVPYSKEAQAILQAPLADREIAIRPDDGNLYLPGVSYRIKLTRAFGAGGWALVPAGEPKTIDTQVFYTGRLYVLGRFAAEAMGMGTYFPNSPKSNYGNALESAKTDALTRCGKDLGIASELWDPQFAAKWRAEHCTKIRNPNPDRFGSKAVKVWVRNDDPDAGGGAASKEPPNLPAPRHAADGTPLGPGAWPKVVRDPSVDASRAMDDDYRRTVGAPAQADLAVVLQKSIDRNTIEVINQKTGEVTYETKAQPDQIARIHILQRECNLDDEAYRNGMKKYYGIETSALLTKAQADEMILRLVGTRNRIPEDMRKHPSVIPDNEYPSADHDDP